MNDRVAGRHPDVTIRMDAERQTQLRRSDEAVEDGEFGAAHEYEVRAAEDGADAEALRYEAANAYSTTVAGPPGPRVAGAVPQAGLQPAPSRQPQANPQQGRR